ncbi:response regulator [Pedobacter sp. MC2016-14]|uniref:response regulator n=1 Tax=Pedobacter sp. MC2016-14 TaxID=2897327 RepID=UPI001E5C6617|nr:response regulator [Pedobacter sp. MC2016-14]MCD0486935.1 response regulator [Pedobacter sp. MC2016-14]
MEKSMLPREALYNILPLNKKILIVEDDDELKDLLTTLLELEGCKVQCCVKKCDFYQLVRRFEPDLIVLDYLLPDITGGELCHQLKLNDQYAHIPVILYTALDPALLSMDHYNCDGFISKPFNLEALLRLMKRLIVR